MSDCGCESCQPTTEQAEPLDHPDIRILAEALKTLIERYADDEGCSLAELDWAEVNGVITRQKWV